MTFGRYKGFTIKEILEDQPHYLTWLSENTDFDIDHKILDLVETSYEDAARNARLSTDKP